MLEGGGVRRSGRLFTCRAARSALSSNRMRWISVLVGALGLSACGDVTALRFDVVFENPETEAETRALVMTVREVTPDPNQACSDFVTSDGPGLRQSSGVLPYPPERDLVLPVGIEPFDRLTYILLAYPSLDTEQTSPLAGSCEVIDTPTAGSRELDFVVVDLPPNLR